MTITIIRIKSFEPYKYYIPLGENFAGSIKIVLPSVQIKIMEFSVLPDYSLGAETEALSYDIEGIAEPGIPRDKLVQFIEASKDNFRDVWKIAQEKINEHGPILGSH